MRLCESRMDTLIARLDVPGLQAALRSPSGHVYKGRSHVDVLLSLPAKEQDQFDNHWSEGFVTTEGRWLTRVQANQRYGSTQSEKLVDR